MLVCHTFLCFKPYGQYNQTLWIFHISDMDITCPSFAPIDETSDYGSRETSTNDEEVDGFRGFCTIPNLLGTC